VTGKPVRDGGLSSVHLDRQCSDAHAVLVHSHAEPVGVAKSGSRLWGDVSAWAEWSPRCCRRDTGVVHCITHGHRGPPTAAARIRHGRGGSESSITRTGACDHLHMGDCLFDASVIDSSTQGDRLAKGDCNVAQVQARRSDGRQERTAGQRR
jgi:hypothetical protein